MRHIGKTNDAGEMIAAFLTDEGYNLLSKGITKNNYRIVFESCEIVVETLSVKVAITVRKGKDASERSANSSFSLEIPFVGNEIVWSDLCLLSQWIKMRIREEDVQAFDIQNLLVFQEPSSYGSRIKGHVSFNCNGEKRRSRIRIEKDTKQCALLDIKLDDKREEAWLIAEIKKNIDFTPSRSYVDPANRNKRRIPIEDVLKEAQEEEEQAQRQLHRPATGPVNVPDTGNSKPGGRFVPTPERDQNEIWRGWFEGMSAEDWV